MPSHYREKVKGLSPSFDSSLIFCPTMVGRASDLAVLDNLAQKAKNGKGHFALIHGEAGIGKSRLVSETKAFAGQLDFVLLQGNCFRSDRFFPFAPLLDMLRGYINTHLVIAAQELKPLAPTLVRLLPDLPLLLPELGEIEDLPCAYIMKGTPEW
jgi:predicted ATPase